MYASFGRTLVRTTDAGASWQPITQGLPQQVVTALTVDPQRSGTVYAGLAPDVIYKTGDIAKSTGGIYKTTNGGDTWSRAASGITVHALEVDPARPTTIYAAGWAAWVRTHVSEFRILRSTDGGRTWATAGLTDPQARPLRECAPAELGRKQSDPSRSVFKRHSRTLAQRAVLALGWVPHDDEPGGISARQVQGEVARRGRTSVAGDAG